MALSDDFDVKYWKRMNYTRSKANRSFETAYAHRMARNRAFDESQNSRYDSVKGNAFGILKIVVLLILVSALFRFLTNPDASPVSFTSFLNWLSTEDFSLLPSAYYDNSIGGSWLLADGIRVFLNTIISIFDMLSFFARNVVNAIFMGGKFLAFFFGITGMSGAVPAP